MLSCTAVVNISISTIMFVMFVWCVREWRSRTRPSWNVTRSRGPVCCLEWIQFKLSLQISPQMDSFCFLLQNVVVKIGEFIGGRNNKFHCGRNNKFHCK